METESELLLISVFIHSDSTERNDQLSPRMFRNYKQEC